MATSAIASSLAVQPASTPSAAIRQRVQAKSTIHESTSDDSSDDGHSDTTEIFTPPSFTIKELLGAIPKHCFERSALRSFSYLFVDIAMLGAFAYLASYIDGYFNFDNGTLLDGYAGSAARFAGWTLYAFAAGTVGMGVWVIGHECGHQAFSTSKTLNNTMGLILHSALLVPYHSWRISHGRHHAGTGSMEKDEVFLPWTRSGLGLPAEHEKVSSQSAAESTDDDDSHSHSHSHGHGKAESTFEALDELFEETPIRNLFWMLVQQLLGFPLYLFNNASGQDFGRWTNHFDPNAPIFDKRHFWQIVLSDIGIIANITTLVLWSHYRSTGEMMRYFFIPYLVVNHHLIIITYTQHSDPVVPRYRKSEWNFQRGALCTIDRNLYGPIGAYVLHGICETHVAHHLCSRIPHYNAWEATDALKAVLGDYYLKSDDNMYYTLFNNMKECRFVEDTGSCLFYKNRFGKAVKRVVYEEDSAVALTEGASASEESELESSTSDAE